MKFYKILLVFAFNFLFLFGYSQLRQVYIDNQSTTNHINKISFYNRSEGYVAFDDWIGYTTDSGRSFTKKYVTLANTNLNGYTVNITFGFSITGVAAINQNIVIVYGDYGFVPAILYSNDGANTFKIVFHSQYNQFVLSGPIRDLQFSSGNNNIGYAIDKERVLKTTNQGQTWSIIKTENNIGYQDLQVINDNNLFISKPNDLHRILKSVNGGTTWTTISSPLPYYNHTFLSYYFLNSLNGWLCIRDDNENTSYFYKTTNGGTTWTLVNEPYATTFFAYQTHFTDINTGYSIDDNYTTWKTTDGGEIWEPLPRDNNFEYLGYGHQAIQSINTSQIWVGGGRGFLELTTNAGGVPIPKAYYKIDTTGYWSSKIVKLNNYSKTGYSYKWIVNNNIISTNYNTTYQHNSLKEWDTIKLIVDNGLRTDTLIKYHYFEPAATITSFSPKFGYVGTYIYVYGSNFNNVSAVKLGGVSTSFIKETNNRIFVNVGNVMSGDVCLYNAGGESCVPGFTFYAPINKNVPVIPSKNLLCKNESITINIPNSQQGVRYDFIDSLNFVYGSGMGNDGNLNFTAYNIHRTGNYRIKAYRENIFSEIFPIKHFITVEKTQSVFRANKVNILSGDSVSYYNYSKETISYNWQLGQDASVQVSSNKDVINVTYNSIGQKTLRLVSTSINGCKDTINDNAVFVYNKPLTDDACFVNVINDSDWFYTPDSPTEINNVFVSDENDFFISGLGNNIKLTSRYGVTPKLIGNGKSYFAKYTTNGALSWYMHLNNGIIGETTKDENGNIYLTGSIPPSKYLYLPNGDSLLMNNPFDATTYSAQRNGFVLKLNKYGEYLWHSVLNGRTVLPKKIVVAGDDIIISGDFTSTINYYRNGQITNMIDIFSYDIPVNTFLVKIKSDGSLRWHCYTENIEANRQFGIQDILIDINKNVIVLGKYEISSTVNDVNNINTVVFQNRVASRNTYLLKFDSTGTMIWNAHLELNAPFVFDHVELTNMVLDDLGNIYCIGYSGSNSVVPIEIKNANGTIQNIYCGNMVLIKFSNDGNFIWKAGTANESARGVKLIYKNKNLYALTDFYNLSAGSSTHITSTDGLSAPVEIRKGECILMQYDTSGILQQVFSSGVENNGRQNLMGFAFDNNDNMYLSALSNLYSGAQQISMFGITYYPNGQDGILTKLNPNYCTSPNPVTANAGSDKSRCSADPVSIGMPAIAGNTYSWRSIPSGFTSSVSNPTVTPLVTTSYILTVYNNSGNISRDTVTITITPSPGCSIVPLTFGTISATIQNGNGLVRWQTFNEKNVSHFIIERSANATEWQSIGELNADNKEINNYQFVDMNILQGKSYYRIKNVDNDGNYTYSKIVNISNQKDVLITASSESKTIMYNIHTTGIFDVQLLNVNGQILYRNNNVTGNVLNRIYNISSGIYILKLTDKNGKFFTKKVICN